MNLKREAALKRWSDPVFVKKMKDMYDQRKKETQLKKESLKNLVKFFKITLKSDPEQTAIYIGATSQPLSSIFCVMKIDSKVKGNEISRYMNEVGVENFDILLIKEAFCKTNTQRNIAKQELIDAYPNLLNQNKALADGYLLEDRKSNKGGNIYYEQNTERMCKKSLEYYYANRERILKKTAVYNSKKNL